ncbi:DUF4435 domain-containing protein [Oscillatoria sp. FACHB-1406]|uniref:DUF4435 domain-containing protein n=1 Tax=Oscillatoria sp. FACHB-1406 TaxID=2692846 RepID=UPI0016865664|nr:DUF4435 domain-containing protein [Oscillatoria sp. FACHB-1406]MBD2580279.1 DUF4435 domain-containing protein [Oscillatoria sp. FACHB-1406]
MTSRTTSGIRNTDLFYRKQYLVIVEGEDDIPFWEMLFPKQISNYECKFKQVGGSEIKKYVDAVYTGNANFAVALDSDYRLFMEKIHDHVQIVETLAHSIENLIIQPMILHGIIRIASRQHEYELNKIEDWFNHFNEVLYDLMVADYMIQKEGLGIKCLSKDCRRFLKNQKTKEPIFDISNINNFIESLNLDTKKLDLIKKELRDHLTHRHIQGHFLFSSSLYFVNHEIQKIRGTKVKRSISNDDFFTMLILECQKSLSDYTDLQILREKANQAAQYVVELISKV